MAEGYEPKPHGIQAITIQFDLPESITIPANTNVQVLNLADLHNYSNKIPSGKVIGMVYLWSNNAGVAHTYATDQYVDNGVVSLYLYNPSNNPNTITAVRLLVITE